MPASPDRALRRLVAELATAASDDVEAVLSGLDARKRKAVEGLLASYRGEVIELPRTEPAAAELINIEGLSPWLTARLDRRLRPTHARPGTFGELAGPEAREAGLTYTMTEAAFTALRESAESLRGQRTNATHQTERDRSRFGRGGRTAFGRRLNG